MRQLGLCPRSTECQRFTSNSPDKAVDEESKEQPPLPSRTTPSPSPSSFSVHPRPALTLEISSPHWSPSSVSGSRSPFSHVTSTSSPSPPSHDPVSTPSMKYRLDSRPSAPSLHVTVTVNSSSPSPPTPTSEPEALSQSTLEAALSNLLSSGLSGSRRFSYPPTTHSFASSPSSKTRPPPIVDLPRATSPALMSPTTASSLFQALDRKRAFRPYHPPSLSASSYHRVTVEVDCLAPLEVRMLQVDGWEGVLVGVELLRGRGVVWGVGLDEAMFVINAMEGEQVRGSGFLSLKGLMEEREVRVRVRGQGGEEWEVRVEVKGVESFNGEEREDRRRMRRWIHESGSLQRRLGGTTEKGNGMEGQRMGRERRMEGEVKA